MGVPGRRGFGSPLAAEEVETGAGEETAKFERVEGAIDDRQAATDRPEPCGGKRADIDAADMADKPGMTRQLWPWRLLTSGDVVR